MELNREALEFLEDQAVSAAAIDKVYEDREVVRLLNHKTGEIHLIEKLPPVRSHTVGSLRSLADSYQRYASDESPSVWVSSRMVEIVIDDQSHYGNNFRQHTISMPVELSPVFADLKSLPKEQRPLVNALRHNLNSTVILPEGFELAISNLAWASGSLTEANIGTVKSTMGRSVTSELKVQREIPREISVTFHPFPTLIQDAPDFSVTVKCSVVTDPDEETISVVPYPGQLASAETVAVEQLRAHIATMLTTHAHDPSVFAGTP